MPAKPAPAVTETQAYKTQAYVLTLTRNCGQVARYDAVLPRGQKISFYAPHGVVIDKGAPPQRIVLEICTA
jgi:hypothetical protein